MNHSKTEPVMVTDDQAELLPALLDGKEADVYVVIQAGDLSSLLHRAWHSLERDRRQITDGRLSVRLMRMLTAGDFIVNTRVQSDRVEQVGQ